MFCSKASVSATFTLETNNNLKGVEVGQSVTVKGVIRSGASYDEDLELYENVILEKSDLIITRGALLSDLNFQVVDISVEVKFVYELN